MDRYPYHEYTILLGATRTLVHIGVHFYTPRFQPVTLPQSLTPTQKFGIAPRVSYTHTEIRDTSPGLLQPHRNLGSLLESLTPTQKFRIAPQVSYTYTKIWDLSPGLLHPHRTFRILPRISFTLTLGFSP